MPTSTHLTTLKSIHLPNCASQTLLDLSQRLQRKCKTWSHVYRENVAHQSNTTTVLQSAGYLFVYGRPSTSERTVADQARDRKHALAVSMLEKFAYRSGRSKQRKLCGSLYLCLPTTGRA